MLGKLFQTQLLGGHHLQQHIFQLSPLFSEVHTLISTHAPCCISPQCM